MSTLLGAPGLVFGAANGSLPPIGQRIYVIGSDGGKSPIAILRDKVSSKGGVGQGARVLRDPTGSGPQARVQALPKHQESVAKAPIPREKPGTVRFRKVTIPGAISRPRIDFAQEPLTLERADETVSGEFFDRIFLPGRDESP